MSGVESRPRLRRGADPTGKPAGVLAGLEGLIALYKDSRALTDELYAGLGLAKLAIENSRQTWAAYYTVEREWRASLSR